MDEAPEGAYRRRVELIPRSLDRPVQPM